MMHCVISIVEAQVIERLAGEVARKVVLGAHVASVVLKEVERQDAILGIKLRQQSKPDPSSPVDEDENAGSAPDGNLFKLALSYDGSIETSLSFEVQLVILVSREDDMPEK
jgi:hypothetical protein